MKRQQQSNTLSQKPRRRDTGRPRARPMAPTSEQALSPAVFQDLSAKVWDLNQVQAFIVRAVEETLERRNVPKHRVCSPKMEVTIPAIDAMRYSPLRNEIAALIASTMDADHAEDAHPSYLNILRQLTEDEVRILASLPSGGRLMPLANLWRDVGAGHTEIIFRNIAPASLAKICASKSRLPHYIDNLMRLQLIQEPNGVRIKDNKVYSNMMRQRFCARVSADRAQRQSLSLEKRAFALSASGEMFRKVCLS